MSKLKQSYIKQYSGGSKRANDARRALFKSQQKNPKIGGVGDANFETIKGIPVYTGAYGKGIKGNMKGKKMTVSQIANRKRTMISNAASKAMNLKYS